jgi:hypothetical protein
MPAWHRCRGETTYELNRVYDARNRLCPERSFWLVIPPEPGDHPRTRWITYEECRRLPGNQGLSFAHFSSPLVPFERIDKWMDAGPFVRRQQRVAVADSAVGPSSRRLA